MMYNASSSRVWVWIGGSLPACTRHSTTAQSPPDCSPASLSSELEPPWVTVRPAPGPERTGSFRAMVCSSDRETTSMEGPPAPSINSGSRSLIRFRESAGGGPGPDHQGTSDDRQCAAHTCGLGRDRCFDDGSSRRPEVRGPNR